LEVNFGANVIRFKLSAEPAEANNINKSSHPVAELAEAMDVQPQSR
jgi:hypothetical protein